MEGGERRQATRIGRGSASAGGLGERKCQRVSGVEFWDSSLLAGPQHSEDGGVNGKEAEEATSVRAETRAGGVRQREAAPATTYKLNRRLPWKSPPEDHRKSSGLPPDEGRGSGTSRVAAELERFKTTRETRRRKKMGDRKRTRDYRKGIEKACACLLACRPSPKLSNRSTNRAWEGDDRSSGVTPEAASNGTGEGYRQQKGWVLVQQRPRQ